MSFIKFLFYVSIAFAIFAIYLRQTIDEEKQNEFFLRAVLKIFDSLSFLDNYLRHLDFFGLRRKGEALHANYAFNNIDTSGLIVDVRKFDGIEVILFDVVGHKSKRPAIIFIHGGGWSFMSPKLYSALTADIARRLNTLVISVDYRKAPEYPYPAGFNDVLAAVRYLFVNADSFDVDPSRIVIMGDSAGGNLAVAVTYRLLSTEGHVARLLVPLCPVLQIADMAMPAMMDNVDDYTLDRRKMINSICNYVFGLLSNSDLLHCIDIITSNNYLDKDTLQSVKNNLNWKQHLKVEITESSHSSSFQYDEHNKRFTDSLSHLSLDPGCSPLSALNDSQIAHLPPMVIFGASKDPLRDDARLLAARATKTGSISVRYEEIDSFHDPFLFSIFGLPGTKEAMDKLEDLVKKYGGL